MRQKWIPTAEVQQPGWYFAITPNGRFTVVKYHDGELTDYEAKKIIKEEIIALWPLGNEMFYAISICKGNIKEAGDLILAEKVAQSLQTA